MQLTNGRIKLEKKISFLYLYIHATLEEKKKCHHWINIRFSSVFCSDKKKKNTYMIKKQNKQTMKSTFIEQLSTNYTFSVFIIHSGFFFQNLSLICIEFIYNFIFLKLYNCPFKILLFAKSIY